MGLYHSKDKGKSWTLVENGIPKEEPIYSINKSNNNLYVGTYGSGLFRSTNNGASFVNIFSSKSEGEPVWQISSQDSKIVIAIPRRGIFYSENNGDSWSDISLKNDPEFSPWGLLIHNNTIFVTSGGKIYKRSILEQDWSEINSNLITNGELYGINVQGEYVIVATGFGISSTLDNGNNWINYDFSKKSVEDQMFKIACNSDYVFSNDQYNVWRTKITNTPVE